MNPKYLPLAFLLVSGCAGPDTVSSVGEQEPFRLTAPILEIGGVETDDGPVEFYRVVSAGFSENGTAVVADVGIFSLVVLPPGEPPIHIDLREGDGPGEGRYISQVGFLQGDTIYWIDSFLRRINLHDLSTGEALGPFPMTYDPDQGLPQIAAPVDDSTFLYLQWRSPTFSGSAEVARGPTKVYCSSLSGVRGWEMTVEGAEQLVIPDGSGHSSNRIPFAARPVLKTWGDLILYSDSRDLGVRILDCDGGEVTRFSLPEEGGLGQDRTRNSLDSWLAEASPGLSARMSGIFEDFESAVTGQGAAHGTILTDPVAGRLWVESAGGKHWILTDSVGLHWAPLDLPGGRIPLAVRGDRVVLLAVDSLGVHRLEIREVEGSGAE